jgi:uncharacterized membrane protein YcaP (DUF421 family)
MEALFTPVDWARVFAPTVPLLETVVRGTCVYVSLLVLLRVVFRRESGTARISMLLLIVLLADAAQNAMAGEYRSVTDGVLLVATIMAWNFVIDFAASRIPGLEGLIHPPPLLLVRNGRILREHMKQESVSDEELWSALRLQGIEDLNDVAKVYMEGDGKYSVIRRRSPRRS